MLVWRLSSYIYALAIEEVENKLLHIDWCSIYNNPLTFRLLYWNYFADFFFFFKKSYFIQIFLRMNLIRLTNGKITTAIQQQKQDMFGSFTNNILGKKFSKYFFFIFQENWISPFYANHLPRRRFAWTVKPVFWWHKEIKCHQFAICWICLLSVKPCHAE